MQQPPPSLGSSQPMPNGHLSPPPIYNSMAQVLPSDSESDLSEAIDAPNTASSSSPVPDAENGVNGRYKADTSESSHDEDALGSDDADFELDNSPPALQQPTHPTRSSSETSSRLGKRKASVEDDGFMLADPELYGLRRSVSHRRDSAYHAEPRLQGRPRPSRRVVITPFPASQVHMLNVSKVDSDSDASGSDIDKAPRKRRRTTYSNHGSADPLPSSRPLLLQTSDLTS